MATSVYGNSITCSSFGRVWPANGVTTLPVRAVDNSELATGGTVLRKRTSQIFSSQQINLSVNFNMCAYSKQTSVSPANNAQRIQRSVRVSFSIYLTHTEKFSCTAHWLSFQLLLGIEIKYTLTARMCFCTYLFLYPSPNTIPTSGCFYSSSFVAKSPVRGNGDPWSIVYVEVNHDGRERPFLCLCFFVVGFIIFLSLLFYLL